MKLLVLTDVFSFNPMGGAGRYLWEINRKLAGLGISITILCQRRHDLQENSLIENVQFKTFSGGDGLGRLLAGCKKFPKLFSEQIDKNKPDVVIFHHPFPYYCVTRKIKWPENLPMIYTFHSSWGQEHFAKFMDSSPGFLAKQGVKWRQKLENNAVNKAKSVIVLSDYSQNIVNELYPGKNIIKIPGGADLEKFKPLINRDEIRQKLGFAKDKKILLTVRRLEKRMGIDNLIKAFAKLKEYCPDIALVIGGTGSMQQELQNLIEELQMQQFVNMTGYIPEEKLSDYYGAADLFVIPSVALEGFGLVTVEALATGTPSAGTPAGGTQEILNEIDSSFVFSGHSVEDILEGLKILLLKKPQLLEMRNEIAQFAKKRYNWNHAAKSFLNIL